MSQRYVPLQLTVMNKVAQQTMSVLQVDMFTFHIVKCLEKLLQLNHRVLVNVLVNVVAVEESSI